MSCNHCPCPGICLGWPAFCAWAREEPPDPINLKHICRRSGMGASLPRDEPRPDVARSMMLTQAMNRCLHRIKLPGCCTASECELARKVVTHLDCFACLEAAGQ